MIGRCSHMTVGLPVIVGYHWSKYSRSELGTQSRPIPWVAKECVSNNYLTDINDKILYLQLRYGTLRHSESCFRPNLHHWH